MYIQCSYLGKLKHCVFNDLKTFAQAENGTAEKQCINWRSESTFLLHIYAAIQLPILEKYVGNQRWGWIYAWLMIGGLWECTNSSLAIFPQDLTIVSSDNSLFFFQLYKKNPIIICMTHRHDWTLGDWLRIKVSDMLTRHRSRLIRPRGRWWADKRITWAVSIRNQVENTQRGADKHHW